MNSKNGPRRHKWFRIARGMATVLAVAFVSLLGYAMWEYISWRNRMIEWDFGTIDILCGGDTEDDRLLDIRFIKKWEYKALKKTSDGKHVWIHWKLSKRHCGNWMLAFSELSKPRWCGSRPMCDATAAISSESVTLAHTVLKHPQRCQAARDQATVPTSAGASRRPQSGRNPDRFVRLG